MPGDVEALLIVLYAVLPGAMYTWGYEREAGSFGVTLADRTLRFIGVSALTHLLLAVPEYALWRWLLAGEERLAWGQFAALFATGAATTVLPLGAGLVIGRLYATRSTRDGLGWLRRWLPAGVERTLLRVALGPAPAPRAWDAYFGTRQSVYLRIRTSDGEWVGGRFTKGSYAAVFPNPPDLFIEEAYLFDDDGRIGESLKYSLYLAASQITMIEIVPENGSA